MGVSGYVINILSAVVAVEYMNYGFRKKYHGAKETVMGQNRYITETESARCKCVADAFAELYEEGDILVLDAGRYGFVELQYYKSDSGFNSNAIFNNSRELFEELWVNWRDVQLMKLVNGTLMQELDCEDIYKCLPEKKREEFMDKRRYFASKAGICLDER